MAVWTFARLTLREAIRSRFVALTGAMALVYIALVAWGCHLILDHSSTRQAQQVSGFGIEVLALNMVSFVLPLIAVFVAGASMQQESESGLLYAMLARPIRRWEMVLGKWCGSALLLAAYVVLLAGGIMGSVTLVLGYHPPMPLQAAGLLWLEALVLLSLRICFGTFLGTMASGVFPLMLYGLAWMGGLVEALGNALGIDAMVNAGIVTSLLVPSDVLWRGVSAFVAPSAAAGISTQAAGGRGNPFISLVPIAWTMIAWAVAYVIATTAIGAGLFSRRDM